MSNNADVIPLDEQHIATDNEEDTADPQYFPGRRRSQELDPDQSDIEDQFLARVRPPSASRSVYLDEGGAAPSAPAEESTATSSKGAAAPSAPARSSHSKIPKGFRQSNTPSPPTSVGRPKSAGAQVWFREEPTRLEAAYPRERTPRTRKPPPAGPNAPPVSQAVVRGYKDPPSADKIGHTIIPEKRGPKEPILKDPPKSLAKQPSTPPPDYPPGKAPPKFGEQQPLNPPPPRPGPPNRPPPVHTVITIIQDLTLLNCQKVLLLAHQKQLEQTGVLPRAHQRHIVLARTTIRTNLICLYSGDTDLTGETTL